jgi:hypothetical protein
MVREDMDADLVIFDADAIAKRSTFQEPHNIPLACRMSF